MNGDVLERARELVAGGLIDSAAQRETIRLAALQILSNGQPIGIYDARIVGFARATWGGSLATEAVPATPFDEEVRELEAARATAEKEWQAALDRMFAAAGRYGELTGSEGLNIQAGPGRRIIETGADPRVRRPEPTREAVEKAIADARSAAAEADNLRDRLKATTAELTRAKRKRSRWRATEALEAGTGS